MTEVKYIVKVWYRSNGLRAMSILLNTDKDTTAVRMYQDLVPVLQGQGYECALETSHKSHKEIHRSA